MTINLIWQISTQPVARLDTYRSAAKYIKLFVKLFIINFSKLSHLADSIVSEEDVGIEPMTVMTWQSDYFTTRLNLIHT
jgi:hypothetical protein